MIFLIVQRVRKQGGGRKILDSQQNIIEDLNKIMSPHTIGNPESILRWSSKAVRKICNELCVLSHKISFKTVSTFIKKAGIFSAIKQKKAGGQTAS